ncbi:MAG: CBS domain-containing protein [Chloroflexota bacterium]
MRIILTHEQADFDALASLLGAYLLDNQAVPILPRHLNRNVRSYLTLYGTELPFAEHRDVLSRPIQSVTLVDTQSLITVKGMQPQTEVYVVDHHDRRDDLPNSWSVVVEPTGATTTLYVEQIQERGIVLTLTQATLLLMGIYEDTGSLSYIGTSPRDVRAAAYLLENGASLRIAANYLKHTLSPAQQMLYDILLADAEMHTIHDQTIVIARAQVEGLEEEISTIAHKLRDLLDPSALFLLVTTRGGVQMVARSTSDGINVAEVATHFGGGGHSRAAASLIKDRTLEEIHQELLSILPGHVTPGLTVGELMSRDPQVLTPDTPAEEAARLMQRYGHEGYPIVDHGKVVGLLTRRAVDRAQAHKLNLPAGSLMEAGEVTVHLGDTIEQVQRLMMDTGWGQIPVIDPQTGEIVGIITRTDLIKTLAPEPEIPGRLNVGDRLVHALPPARLALLKMMADMAHQQGDALYIVGGFVRDLLLDQPSVDFDLVVEGDAIALNRALAKRFGGRVTSHDRFGTSKWHIKTIRSDLAQTLNLKFQHELPPHSIIQAPDLPETVDLVTARQEFYTHPTALPTVERGNIKLDLHRRDFTINTLAVRLDGNHYGELHNYWGGLNDLHQGKVRVLHSLSFVDDPTRMLRAVRFEQRFEFNIEERTLQLLKEARSLLDRVSGDRIRHELDYILNDDRVAQMLSRLHELGLLKNIHPDLNWDEWLSDRISSLSDLEDAPEWHISPEFRRLPLKRALGYSLLLIRLTTSQAGSVMKRLKLTHSLWEAIESACQLWSERNKLKKASPSELTFQLDNAPHLTRYAFYKAVEDPKLKTKLHKYATQWQHVHSKTTGDDLRALRLPPGPHYREILQTLRAAWLDGKISSQEEETRVLEELIHSYNLNPNN